MKDQSTKYEFFNVSPFHPWTAKRHGVIGRGFTQSEALMDLELRLARASEPEIPEPCTDEAYEAGCTCSVPFAGAHDIDPPEPKRDRHCPLHGSAPDPDDYYDRLRDDRLTGDR